METKKKLYSIQFLHQITTSDYEISDALRLYSIQFLHQITTGAQASANNT